MMTSLPGIAGRSVGEEKPRGRILERVLCRGRIVNSKEWDWACLGGILWILLQARVCDAQILIGNALDYIHRRMWQNYFFPRAVY